MTIAVDLVRKQQNKQNQKTISETVSDCQKAWAPDQDEKHVRPALNPIRLTLMVFLRHFFKTYDFEKKNICQKA